MFSVSVVFVDRSLKYLVFTSIKKVDFNIENIWIKQEDTEDVSPSDSVEHRVLGGEVDRLQLQTQWNTEHWEERLTDCSYRHRMMTREDSY